jgi:hypothetical protein
VEPSRINAVAHVHREAPRGVEEALRWFYGQVAELEEVAPDEPARYPLVFRSEQIELRFRFVDAPAIGSIEATLTLAVPSLARACEMLSERRVPLERITGTAYTDRRYGAKFRHPALQRRRNPI